MAKNEYPEFTDVQLLEVYLADPAGPEGRRAADALLGRYHSRVFQWCRGYVRNPDEAMDLAQEVMINAFKGLDGFDKRAQFSSWLFAIARNRCLTAVSRGKQNQEALELIAEPASEMANAEDVLRQRQEDKALRLLLGSGLAPEEEEAFWLRIVEGLSVEQITWTLRLQNTTGARSVLQNARRKLRRIWGDRMDEFKGVD